MQHENRVVIVTGSGGSGCGRSIATHFAFDGAAVVVSDIDETGGNDTVRLIERKRGAWNLSGPVGPASFAGPLQASISSRLPPWGAGLFELSTYTASVSMFAFAHPILPLLAIGNKHPLLPVWVLARPFSPAYGWKSGFSIAPQLGWRASALSYAIVQAQQRLLPALSGNRGLISPLPVTVQRERGESVLFCEQPKPRFANVRNVASLTVRFAGSFASF